MSIFKIFWIKTKSFQFKLKEKTRQIKRKNFHKYDEKLVQQLSGKKVPSLEQMNYISQFLSKSERLIIRILSGLMVIAVASLLINIYWNNSSLIPKDGGSYTEGLVGSPRYINPLFAQANDVDLDIAALVYSGLVKFTHEGLTKDLATSFSISPDQKIYTFNLRQDVKWHDGESFKADDVMFTFARINNQETKTPLYFTFRGAKIEKVDDYTIRFILEEPFAPFLESLNVGILPEHIWSKIENKNMTLADYNLKPIGTGPYKFVKFRKHEDGKIESFHLEKFEGYYGNKAHIKEITFKFSESFEQAVESLNNKNVEGISYLPKEIRARIINNRNLNFNLLQLPQYTAVFFNYKDNPALQDLGARKILAQSVNKEKIVNEILNAEAQVIEGSILPGSLGFTTEMAKYPFNPEQVKIDLEKQNWTMEDYTLDDPKTETKKEEVKTTDQVPDSKEAPKPEEAKEEYAYQVRQKGKTYLEFDLTTVNQAQNVKIAKEIQKNWQQIGAKVNLVIVDPNDIQKVIQNRDYEALLYSQILGLDPDPFPFWHSSFTSYPGLNLSSLKETSIDKLLEEARKISDDTLRAEKYTEFQKQLAEKVPAIFLFNPTYTYPQSKKIKGFNTQEIINPANRFNEISDWYIKTDRRWGK